MAEIVYVLTNEAMEGIVKIGRTEIGIDQRIRQLDNTCLPLPFQCFYAAEVEDSVNVEKTLHHIFVDKRIRSNREFFRVDANQLKSAISLAALREVTPHQDVVTDATDVQALKRAAAREERRSALKFFDLDIPVGATLHFVRDENITCTIVADWKVDFEGTVMSATKAARTVMSRLGYDRYFLNGNEYWLYEDEILVARRLRMEEEQESDLSDVVI